VLLYGAAGIGRTTLIDALTPPPGGTVLRCAPAEEDARLPFVGLIDLFAKVPEVYVEGLPAGGRSRLAVRSAVLEALKAFAADTGTLYPALLRCYEDLDEALVVLG
jgi:hypothetical protein